MPFSKLIISSTTTFIVIVFKDYGMQSLLIVSSTEIPVDRFCQTCFIKFVFFSFQEFIVPDGNVM